MRQGESIFLQERKPHLPQQPWPLIVGGHVAGSPGETHSEPGTTGLTPVRACTCPSNLRLSPDQEDELEPGPWSLTSAGSYPGSETFHLRDLEQFPPPLWALLARV